MNDLQRGACRRVLLHKTEPCEESGPGLEMQISRLDCGEDGDPFGLGSMDLDGQFCPPISHGEPAVEEVRDSKCRTGCQNDGSSDSRLIRGELFLGISSKPVHPSHCVMYWAGIHCCSRCGSWGVSRVLNLAKPCTGTPSTAGREALKKIGSKKAPGPNVKLQGGQSLRPVLVIAG